MQYLFPNLVITVLCHRMFDSKLLLIFVSAHAFISLPMKCCINFKIALLVFKCLKHCASGYLQQLIALHKPSTAYDFCGNCNMLFCWKKLVN